MVRLQLQYHLLNFSSVQPSILIVIEDAEEQPDFFFSATADEHGERFDEVAHSPAPATRLRHDFEDPLAEPRADRGPPRNTPLLMQNPYLLMHKFC